MEDNKETKERVTMTLSPHIRLLLNDLSEIYGMNVSAFVSYLVMREMKELKVQKLVDLAEDERQKAIKLK